MTTILNRHGRRIDFDAAAQLMDKDLTDAMDAESWVDEQEFFNAYCQRHHQRFGDEFEPDKTNPVW
jgi:hypothetical protein